MQILQANYRHSHGSDGSNLCATQGVGVGGGGGVVNCDMSQKIQ